MLFYGVNEMKWNVSQVREYRGEPMPIEQTANREEALMERNQELLAVSDIKATGFLIYDNRAILASFNIDYTITLPSSRSLEPVVVACHVPINETYVTDEEILANPEYADEAIFLIENNEVDLTSAIDDAILLNIPSQVLTEEEENSDDMPEGSGWTVISQENYQQKRETEKEESVDPRLASLKALLEDEENEE